MTKANLGAVWCSSTFAQAQRTKTLHADSIESRCTRTRAAESQRIGLQALQQLHTFSGLATFMNGPMRCMVEGHATTRRCSADPRLNASRRSESLHARQINSTYRPGFVTASASVASKRSRDTATQIPLLAPRVQVSLHHGASPVHRDAAVDCVLLVRLCCISRRELRETLGAAT